LSNNVHIIKSSILSRLQMRTNQSFAPSISLILKKISDDKALVLLNSIAAVDGEKYIQLKRLNLTTKQYYSRISGLTDAGLIKRHKGKYSLTMLGHVVYDSQLIIGKTLAYYWKIKAIESIKTSSTSGVPNDEITQLINSLIDNHRIKDILMKSISSSTENLHTENNSDNNVDT
jgi:predicted transcriptional regulator